MVLSQQANVPKGYKVLTMVWTAPCKSIDQALNVLQTNYSNYDLMIGVHILVSDGGAIRGNMAPSHFEAYGTICERNNN